jgi:hypothetical protein
MVKYPNDWGLGFKVLWTGALPEFGAALSCRLGQVHYSGRALVHGPYMALDHGPYLPCEGLPKTSSVKGDQLTSRNFCLGRVGCLWWALTSAWRAWQFCTGSYYNALFMGLRGGCTSSLIGFFDTSLFFSFVALCFIHVPLSWFLVGMEFSLNFTLPLAPWPV